MGSYVDEQKSISYIILLSEHIEEGFVDGKYYK